MSRKFFLVDERVIMAPEVMLFFSVMLLKSIINEQFLFDSKSQGGGTSGWDQGQDVRNMAKDALH